ncbi:uncharacterized protein LOC128883608 [Hylaeus volcanicus]|uniref:uncharacterized protein LOC128883608 n=1 Tax=Hylaeus volcanicus TaxID=313075 RepID=UPI0023B84B98|nr:uncharacterized protein LOC128883608 [Hylaeus volcanicus]
MEEEGIRFDFEDAIAKHESTVQQNQLYGYDDCRSNHRLEDSHVSDQTAFTKRFFQKKYKSPYNRDKATVCLYWIRGLCWNGDSCEYLHEYDIMKLPLCLNYKKNGYCENQQKGCCLFSHEPIKSNNDTPICIHYFLGFCRSGPRCRKKHELRTPDKLPKLLPDWYLHLILSNAQSVLPTISDPETEALMQDVDAMCRNLENSGFPRNDSATKKTNLDYSTNNTFHSNLNSTSSHEKLFPTTTVESISNNSSPNQGSVQQDDAVHSKFSRVYINNDCVKRALEKGIPNIPYSGDPKKQAETTKIFIIKSSCLENIHKSVRLGIWATGKYKTLLLETTYKEFSNVILIFSANSSGGFQGYGRMRSTTLNNFYYDVWGNLSVRLGKNFRVQWIKQCKTSFAQIGQLVNPLNENQLVRKCRDCQEIPFVEGSLLCNVLDQSPSIDLLKENAAYNGKIRLDHTTFFDLPATEQKKIENELQRSQIEIDSNTQVEDCSTTTKSPLSARNILYDTNFEFNVPEDPQQLGSVCDDEESIFSSRNSKKNAFFSFHSIK